MAEATKQKPDASLRRMRRDMTTTTILPSRVWLVAQGSRRGASQSVDPGRNLDEYHQGLSRYDVGSPSVLHRSQNVNGT